MGFILRQSLYRCFLLISVWGLSGYADEVLPFSPVALVADAEGDQLYVADYGSSRILRIDRAMKTVETVVQLSARPTGMAHRVGTKTLYVTTAVSVVEVGLKEKRVIRHFPAGHSPMAPVVSLDGGVLYFVNRFDDDISFVNLDDGSVVRRVSVRREPVAMALAPDGGQLVVVNHLPDGAVDGPDVGAVVSVIDTEGQRLAADIRLPDGSTSVNGVCISPDGELAFITHILGRNRVPATQLANGWLLTNAVSVIDLKQLEYLDTFILDDVGRGAGMLSLRSLLEVLRWRVGVAACWGRYWGA